MSSYDTNLDKNSANYVPLTPLTFLERAKDIYPNYEAKFMKIEVILGVKFINEPLSLPVPWKKLVLKKETQFLF